MASVIENQWYEASEALTVGIAVFGAMVFHVAVIAPSGMSTPPPEIVPFFVFNTTAAAISFVLLRRSPTTGIPASIITGSLVIVSLALLGTGTVGELPTGANPLGPLAYAALGVAVILTAILARRGGMGGSRAESL